MALSSYVAARILRLAPNPLIMQEFVDYINGLGVLPTSPTAITQTYSTATSTHAAPTAVALTNSTGGTGDGTLSAVGDTMGSNQATAINNNLTELATQGNALVVDVANVKQLLNRVVDVLQTAGYLS